MYGEEFFTEAAGPVTAYVPVNPDRATTTIAGGRHFVAVHVGPFTEFDLTYSALGTYVAEHGTADPRPIREIYLVSPPDTTDPAELPHRSVLADRRLTPHHYRKGAPP